MYNINIITFQVVKNNNSSLLTGLPLKWVYIKYDQHFLINWKNLVLKQIHRLLITVLHEYNILSKTKYNTLFYVIMYIL